MKRVYCNSILDEGSTYQLEEKYYIHLIRVMRLNIGSEIALFNPNSGEWKAVIKKINKQNIIAEVSEKISSSFVEPNISLLFSPIKNLNSEAIIRQSTELGVRNIYPTFFQRTVIKKINLSKFSSYSIGAAQQCGRMSIPTLDNYQKLDQRIDLLSKCHVLMFDENLQGDPIQKINSSISDNKTEIIVIIGPEGGFEEKERQMISKNSKTFQNISLGPRILKVDTAVIAALSLTFHYFS
ncbi:16S rRNA (uracil(1498)-N(3))-methyltransferase [Alphaproteobacteria bacterium]|nr:16S rRNA (uracil(1498)-N(3))-methyltransferase [Alphaproteobacteria bacterium]MDB3973851.1 16S rRNA (uracil(1498)-N(3))-methyltransferase [Alphaproteobacteria bacterium]